MQRLFDPIYVHYDLPLPVCSDVIIKSIQMWLINPQCRHKEKQKIPIFGEIPIKASPPIYISATTLLWQHKMVSFC